MPVPITGLYAGVLALLYLVLASVVIFGRFKTGIGVGHGENKQFLRKIRVHANFGEYVPLTLLLLALLELNDAGTNLLHGLGGTLVLSRLLHAWGLTRYGGVSIGRSIGFTLNSLVLGTAAVFLVWQWTSA